MDSQPTGGRFATYRRSRRSRKIRLVIEQTTRAEDALVPRISAFYGIAIYMYYREEEAR
jgi:hypothetical protein